MNPAARSDIHLFHREAPDDRWMPNLTPQRGAQRAPVVRGPYVSIQVNVDENGANIIDDAANEPSMAIDPTDPRRIVVGWRQFDTIASNFRQAGVGYSHDGGKTWSGVGVLDPGVFRSDPVLDSDSAGNMYYFSLKEDFSSDLIKSVDSAVTWLSPVAAFGGDKHWMAVDRSASIGAGNIYGLWREPFSCCGPNIFTRSTDGGASFMQPVPLPASPLAATITVDVDGTVFVAGVLESNVSAFRVIRSSNALDPLSVPEFDLLAPVDLGGQLGLFSKGPNPEGLLGQVWVATDQSGGPTRGNVYVLCSVDPSGDDPTEVSFARSTDGGETWSDPVRVNDDALDANAWQWFGTMSVAPNGRIDAVWNDTRNTGVDNLSELYYAYSSDAGSTWSRNIPVSPVFDSRVGWPRQNKLGDYYHMISDDTGANVAYAATFRGEQDVYFLRIGIPDSDNDRDVDLADFAQCQICFTGDGGEVAAGCEICDVDRDGAVSLVDLVGLTDLFGGPCASPPG